MDQRFCTFYQSQCFFLRFFLEEVDLLPEFFDQLQFFKHIDCLPNVPCYFCKGRLEQPFREEKYVLDRKYLDRVIPMLILADPTEDLKGVRAVSVHANEAIACDLAGCFLYFVVFLTEQEGHLGIIINERKMGEAGEEGRRIASQKLLFLLIKHTKMKDEHYEVADLTSLIKGRQSVTPKSSQNNGKTGKSQVKQGDSEYQSNKSQYTTNYYSTSQGQPMKNPKTYRQEINFTKYQSPPGQFIAYCIVVKQSNLGIYSHERLLVLDSYNKELKYYSEIPTLPILKVESLTNPKEVVKVLTAKKFMYVPLKNGIGQVVVSWMQGSALKEWKITMSSRRIAKEFGTLIQLIRNSEYLLKKEQQLIKKAESNVAENKVNKKETPFISEIKKLEEKSNTVSKKDTVRSSVPKEEIVNIGSEIMFSNTPFERKKAENDNREELKEQTNENINFILDEKVAQPQQTIIEESPKAQTQQQQQPQAQSQPPAVPISIPQIKFEQIIKQAEKQHTTFLQINSPRSQNKRFYELQNILNTRLSKEKQHRSSINSHNGHRLSEKKATVKKAEKGEDESLRNSRADNQITEVKNNAKDVVARRQSRYEQNYNSFRLSLLEERRQKGNEQNSKLVNISKQQPKRESTRSRSTQMQSPKVDNWLMKWLFAGSRDELANIYCNFVEECQNRVKKLALRFENWHLFHKNGQEFHFQESEIEFTYFIFRENCDSAMLLKKEQQLQRRIKNWSYLLGFVRKDVASHRFAVPLSCMVYYKGLKVFCKASFNSYKPTSMLIENITQYLLPLRELESACKIALDRSQLYEMNVKDTMFLYFNELDALPRVADGQWIDSNYIDCYIQQGVVRNQFDVEEMNKHIKGKLFSRLCHKLNNSYILTCIELQEMLVQLGLNKTFIPELYAFACNGDNQQALIILSSEILAVGLANAIRMGVHRYLLKQHSGDIEKSIFATLSLFVEENLVLLEDINNYIKQVLNLQSQVDFKHCLPSYVISSALLKLSLRCEFLNKLSEDTLLNLTTNIWPQVSFDSQNISIHAVTDTLSYNYDHFVSSQLLSTVFSKSITFPQGVSSEKILAQLNPNERNPYHTSNKFKLMPKHLKIRLNYYLAHFCPPVNRNLGLSFESQYTEVYFNLYQHSTACIQTQQSFSQDLIGIKWLIKKGKYDQADSKIQQQRQRVWIWARHHPRILLQLHDVESLYAQRRGRLNIAMQRSLTSLQLAIHFYGSKSDRSWQIIWEKAFSAAEMHYQVHKFQRAKELYEICNGLNERMKGEDLGKEEVNEQFLEVYNRQAMLLLTEGLVSECIDSLNQTVDKLQQWRQYFSQQKLRINILVKVQSQTYDAYRLLLRCWQIKSQYSEYHNILTKLLYTYFQKDWSEAYLSNPRFKLTDISKSRFSELIKSSWLYVVKHTESINTQLVRKGETMINMRIVKVYLQEIRQENHGFYRYTSQELFKYIIQLVVSLKTPANISHSNILQLLIDCLSSLSRNQIKHQRCKLYDQHSKSNKLLFLESMTHLAGYEFCLGTMQECFQDYSFSF